MKVERTRENVFTIVATGQELSALLAGARMSLEVMRAAPQSSRLEAAEHLERVLADFARAGAHLADGEWPASCPRRPGVSRGPASGGRRGGHLVADVRRDLVELGD